MNLNLNELRQNALSRAQAMGYPQRRTEAYRYLNLKALRETAWAPAAGPTPEQLLAARPLVRENALSGRELLVFWNGIWVRELSLTSDLEVAELAPADWTAVLAAVPGPGFDYFDMLNESRWGGGLRVRVPTGSARRLQLLFIAQSLDASARSSASVDGLAAVDSAVSAGGSRMSDGLGPVASAVAGTWAPSQTLVEIGEGASVDVFEQHLGASALAGPRRASWNQPEIRVALGAGAAAQWVQWQNLAAADFAVQRTRFVVGGGTRLHALHIAAGGVLTRQNLDCHVTGMGADVTLNGITLVGPGQTADFHTLVDHAVGGSRTRQLYKGILGSDAQAVFNGRVVIRKGAQKASSEQLNQNLLLGDRAEIDSKPELEIFADDVKATHGSAIGQLNDEEVFYLRSRGIPRAQAQEMIALGSVVGLVDELEGEALKTRLTQALGAAYRRIHE